MPPDPFEPPPEEYEDQQAEEAAVTDESRDAGAATPTESATDAKKFARKKNRQKFEQREKDNAWRRMLGDQWGRAALWDILADDCRVLELRFAATPTGFPDPLATFYQAGQRSIGDTLWQRLMVIDFGLFHLLLQEHHPAFKPSKG